MTTLTAYNQDVQRYIEKGNKKEKNRILQELKEEALKNGINFNQLFPSGSKRLKVLDEVIYMLSGGGICKISSTKLAENVGCSVRTVYDSVKGIKKLGLIIVGGLADGKNKYVFLYKNHADFIEILSSVFYLDAEQIAEQIAEQKNPESVDTEGFEGVNSTPNSNNITIFKQEKDIIRDSIEKDIEEAENDKEKAREYLHNIHQKMLYTIIKNDNLLDSRIRSKALIITLRAGSNMDEKLKSKALVSVRKIDRHLYFGGSVDSIPALFDRIYHDRIKYSDYNNKRVAPVEKRDTSIYYDWLND